MTQGAVGPKQYTMERLSFDQLELTLRICDEYKAFLEPDLGRAASIAITWPKQKYDDAVMRAELLDAIHLQQYVPSPPTQSYLILFLQSAQRSLCCFRW